MSFKLLSCDGGGIRGLISAMLIQDLDRDLEILKKVQGFAGTSTGALIALGLAAGIPIDAIVEIYKAKGKEIFQKNGWLESHEVEPPKPPVPEDESVETSGPGFLGCRYKNDGLIKIATELLGKRTLKDLSDQVQAYTYVGVAAVQLYDAQSESWKPRTLSSANSFQNIKMVDAALASAAAPTYFPPYEISKLGFFADGGLFANDPAMCALADIVTQKVAPLSEVSLLSIGTGHSPEGIPPSDIPKPLDWGVNYWMWPWQYRSVPAMSLLNLTMEGASQATAAIAESLLGDSSIRANPHLKTPIPLDAWEDVDQIERLTKQYMESSEWHQVKKWVHANWA